MSLTLEYLSKAVTRLEEAVQAYEVESEDLLRRDGLIQRFEFTYELAFKMLRRALERDLATVGV